MSTRRRGLVACALCLLLIAAPRPVPVRADAPGWHERYLLSVICAKQQCAKNPSAELPAGLLDLVDSIWGPILRSTNIPSDEKIELFYPLRGGVNAWAIKHYWGISLGLLSIGLTRDEIGFVVAHEMAHIELGHYQKKLEEIASIYVVAFLVIILSGGHYNPLNDPLFGLAVDLALAAYSREKEAEADQRALRVMTSAGFDPRASTSALTKIRPFGQPGTGDLFDSHPSIEHRVARLQAEMVALNLPASSATAMPAASATLATPSAQLPASPRAPAPPVTVAPGPPPPTIAAPRASPSPRPTPSAGGTRATQASRPRVTVLRELTQNAGWAAVIRVGDIEVFRVRTYYAGQDIFQRADAAAVTLNRLIANGLNPGEVTAGTRSGRWVILAKNEVVLTVDPPLARLYRLSPRQLATVWAAGLRWALTRSQP